MLRTVIGDSREDWFETKTREKTEEKNAESWNIVESPLSTPRLNELLQLHLKGTST